MQQLKGKTALITGASRGIGAACAEVFSGLGMNLVLLARSESVSDLAAQCTQAKAVVGDVADYEAVAEAVQVALRAFGRLDILINNAGLIEPISLLAESEPSHWSHVLDVNVKGVYHGLRAASPVMMAQGHGVVINLSSGAARNAMEGWSHYCASKAAVASLTQCANKELHPHGIRVLGLSPGTVATQMQKQIKASGINPVSGLDPSVHIPPVWVAQAIAWLCTDEAASLHGRDVSLRDRDIREQAGLPV